MRACDLLRADRDDLVASWARAATQAASPGASANTPLVVDGIPEVLGELADSLDRRDGQDGRDHPRAAHWDAAREHVMGRLRQGLEVTQVLREYRILRGVVSRRLIAAWCDLDDVDDLARANEALDLALTEAIADFDHSRESSLEAETERLRLALDAAGLGMWEWMPKEGVLTWDRRTREIFGVGTDVAVSYDLFLSRLHRDDRDRVDAVVQEKVRSAESGNDYRLAYRVIAGGGVERWVSAMGRILLRDEQGRCVRFIGATLDVSETKRAEQVEAQNAVLRERFLGIVSHDLRNPLATIRMSVDAALKTGDVTPAVRGHLERIVKKVDRMTRMIADLLDLTRSRLGGGIPITPQPADMKDIADGVVESVRLTRPGRGISTQVRGSASGEWDPDRVAQALGNIVTNALDHGDPGTPVGLLVLDEGDSVAVVVHNEGEPIPADRLTHLFDPFQRAGSGGSHGLGLGLFIAHEITRAHGGTLTCTSARTSGTTFRLTLPRRRGSPSGDAATPAG